VLLKYSLVMSIVFVVNCTVLPVSHMYIVSIRGAQIPQNSNSHLKILVARWAK